MKNFTKVLFAVMLLVSFVATAQDEEESPLEVTGSVDTYYTGDFAGEDNIGTSFADDRHSFSLGMIDVGLSKSYKNVSMYGEFSFGPRSFKSIPTLDPGDGDDVNVNIQNLYISYGLTDKLSLTAGYMGTFVGYEVISPAANFNYSTSYLFTNGPFQNAGLKADYAFSDKFAVMVGIFNDWNVYADNNKKKDFGAQVYVAPIDGWDVYANFVIGESGMILDLTTGFQMSDEFYLGLNAADYSFDDENLGGYSGVAIYPQYAFGDAFSLGLRGEWFSFKDTEVAGVTTEGTSVFATTLSANYSVGGFTFIPEVRFDSASEDIFIDGDALATGGAGQFTFAAVYAF
ncbi:MAG: porin [Reichenbachiella sp.]